MDNPQKLKEKYIKAMDKILIKRDVEKLTFEIQGVTELRRQKEIVELMVENMERHLDTLH